jgi:hypothetical protein
MSDHLKDQQTGLLRPKAVGGSLWLTAVVFVTAAVVLLYLPLLRAFSENKISSTYPDALEFIWSTWRLEGVLTGEKQLYYSTELFAPKGSSLLLHTICEGVLIPITAILSGLDPIWRYNISLCVVSLLSGWAALSLFRSLGCSYLAAALASTTVIYSPWIIGHLHAGHLNFVGVFALIEAIRGMIVRSGLRYSLAITLLCFTNLYYLYFAALLLPAFILFAGITRNGCAAAGKLLMSFIIGLLPAAAHLTDIARLARLGSYSPDHNPAKHAADLLALLVPSPVQSIGARQFIVDLRNGVPLHIGESSLYIGSAVTVAALLACGLGTKKTTLMARFFSIVSLFFCILSLGPLISWRGSPVIANPLDYAARLVLPLYPSVPARFAGVASLMAIAAGCQLLNKFQTKRVRLVGYSLFIMAALEFLPTELKVYPLPIPSPTLEYLAHDKNASLVVDLSASPQYAMLRQTVHGKPIATGFLSRRPRYAERDLNRNHFIRQMRGEAGINLNAALSDWCMLSANRLILELPTAQVHHEDLSALGFTLVSSDPYVALFATDADICPHSPSGPQKGSRDTLPAL